MGTKFVAVYDRFLGKITDDMYMELTPQDTIKDLRRLLIDAIPGFEFPRVDLYSYKIDFEIVDQDKVQDGDFVLGTVWNELEEPELDAPPKVIVEHSAFEVNLSSEEINILAILMMNGWLQRQLTSVENVRMKYSSQEYKFTSQANHMAKLQSLLAECQRQSLHMQRLYKRREKSADDGLYKSTWAWFGEHGTRNLY